MASRISNQSRHSKSKSADSASSEDEFNASMARDSSTGFVQAGKKSVLNDLKHDPAALVAHKSSTKVTPEIVDPSFRFRNQVSDPTKQNENSADTALPPGWILKESRSYPGRFYYFNNFTGESTWNQPEAIHPNPGEIRVFQILFKHSKSLRPIDQKGNPISRSLQETREFGNGINFFILTFSGASKNHFWSIIFCGCSKKLFFLYICSSRW